MPLSFYLKTWATFSLRGLLLCVTISSKFSVGGGTVLLSTGPALELPYRTAGCAHQGTAQVKGFLDVFSPRRTVLQRCFLRIRFDAEFPGWWVWSCLCSTFGCFVRWLSWGYWNPRAASLPGALCGSRLAALMCHWADQFIPASRQMQTQKFARKCARRMSLNPSCPLWRIIRW